MHQVRNQVTKTSERTKPDIHPAPPVSDITPEKPPIASQDSVTLWESHIYAHWLLTQSEASTVEPCQGVQRTWIEAEVILPLAL